MLSFETLWKNHPANRRSRNIDPCKTNGQPNFNNQCAIRMGVALTSSGIKIDGYDGVFCWHGHSRRHPLRVEELIKWLSSSHATFINSRPEISKIVNGVQKNSDDYIGRTGIVAFRNFWGAGNQGDHIDLWNGNAIAYGSNDYFERSEEIWFWEMP